MKPLSCFHDRLIKLMNREYGIDTTLCAELVQLDAYLNSADASADPDAAIDHLTGLCITQLLSRP